MTAGNVTTIVDPGEPDEARERVLAELAELRRERERAERARARAMARTEKAFARARELEIGGSELARVSGLARTTVDRMSEPPKEEPVGLTGREAIRSAATAEPGVEITRAEILAAATAAAPHLSPVTLSVALRAETERGTLRRVRTGVYART